jgi:phasin family protein
MAKKTGETVAAVSETEPAVQAAAAESADTGQVAQVAVPEPERVAEAAVPKVAKAPPAPGIVISGVIGPAAGSARAHDGVRTDGIRTGVSSMVKTVEDIFAFSQGNVEAFVKSSQIWAAGVQDLSKAVAATAQAQLDHTFATVKAMAAIKSVKEVVDLQTNLARASVEKAVAETGKLTDASVKLAEQAWAPITERMTLAVEKFGRAA